MKQFIAFVRKEFFHIFRDRRTMLILLGMPVVQIILFGFAISTEVKNVRVAVLDPNNDVMTRHIVDRINASEYFMVTRLLHSPQEVEKAFREGDTDLAIVFGTQFADRLYAGDAEIQLITDATDPNMAINTGKLCYGYYRFRATGNDACRRFCSYDRAGCQVAL